MKLNHLFAAGAMLLALGAFVACTDKEDQPEEKEAVAHILEVTCDSPTDLSDVGGEVVFNIKSNTEWHVTSSASWAVPSKTKSRANGTVAVKIGDNPSLNVRTAVITMSDCMDLYDLLHDAHPDNPMHNTDVTTNANAFVFSFICFSFSSSQSRCTRTMACPR